MMYPRLINCRLHTTFAQGAWLKVPFPPLSTWLLDSWNSHATRRSELSLFPRQIRQAPCPEPADQSLHCECLLWIVMRAHICTKKRRLSHGRVQKWVWDNLWFVYVCCYWIISRSDFIAHWWLSFYSCDKSVPSVRSLWNARYFYATWTVCECLV